MRGLAPRPLLRFGARMSQEQAGEIPGMHLARANDDHFSGATALVLAPIPNASRTSVDHANRPGFVAMAGILMHQPHCPEDSR